jgi:carboxypeptidase A4
MKFLGVTLASLGFVSAASVSNSKKVNYDDWQVFRVNGPSNTAKFQEVVNKLQLDVWKGKPASGDVVDVSVPAEQLSAFEASTKGLEIKVMHENLGLSIAEENTFSVYAGKSSTPRNKHL